MFLVGKTPWFSSKCPLALAFAVMGGCIATGGRGYPLYGSDRKLSATEVASLVGRVQDVDGEDVRKRGGSFELLPGCHVVGTPAKVGNIDVNGMMVVSSTRVLFALPMKAGMGYVVEIDENPRTRGPAGAASMRARETDPAGHTVREFAPTTDPSELAACQRKNL
jgi:hypothetical protein